MRWVDLSSMEDARSVCGTIRDSDSPRRNRGKSVNHSRVPLRPGPLPQDLPGFFERESLPVWTIRRHRIERVRDRHNARAERNRLPG